MSQKTGLYQGRYGSGSLILGEAVGNSGERGVLRGRLCKDARFENQIGLWHIFFKETKHCDCQGHSLIINTCAPTHS